jgi:hypothetical protein
VIFLQIRRWRDLGGAGIRFANMSATPYAAPQADGSFLAPYIIAMVGRCQPFVRGIPVARLFISYKRDEQTYAYAIRQSLLEQGWASDDIFVDVGHLRERKLLAEAEAAEVVLFIASDASLDLELGLLRRSSAPKGLAFLYLKRIILCHI